LWLARKAEQGVGQDIASRWTLLKIVRRARCWECRERDGKAEALQTAHAASLDVVALLLVRSTVSQARGRVPAW
jgi:hypothetical protein